MQLTNSGNEVRPPLKRRGLRCKGVEGWEETRCRMRDVWSHRLSHLFAFNNFSLSIAWPPYPVRLIVVSPPFSSSDPFLFWSFSIPSSLPPSFPILRCLLASVSVINLRRSIRLELSSSGCSLFKGTTRPTRSTRTPPTTIRPWAYANNPIGGRIDTGTFRWFQVGIWMCARIGQDWRSHANWWTSPQCSRTKGIHATAYVWVKEEGRHCRHDRRSIIIGTMGIAQVEAK